MWVGEAWRGFGARVDREQGAQDNNVGNDKEYGTWVKVGNASRAARVEEAARHSWRSFYVRWGVEWVKKPAPTGNALRGGGLKVAA